MLVSTKTLIARRAPDRGTLAGCQEVAPWSSGAAQPCLRSSRHYEQGGRHGRRFAGVVEPRLIGGIDRKFLGGLEVHSGEIADGVVIIGIWRAGISQSHIGSAERAEP